MKLLVSVACFFLLSASKGGCKKKQVNADFISSGCYKGKLEVKGGCMNYTISIVDGKFDSSLVVPDWTNESTGKAYKNVFALGSRCTFPDNINEGDEFFFVIDNTAVQNCAVCMMYYPVPAKKLPIKVIQDPCPK
jgi:hypothetical protein